MKFPAFAAIILFPASLQLQGYFLQISLSFSYSSFSPRSLFLFHFAPFSFSNSFFFLSFFHQMPQIFSVQANFPMTKSLLKSFVPPTWIWKYCCVGCSRLSVKMLWELQISYERKGDAFMSVKWVWLNFCLCPRWFFGGIKGMEHSNYGRWYRQQMGCNFIAKWINRYIQLFVVNSWTLSYFLNYERSNLMSKGFRNCVQVWNLG